MADYIPSKEPAKLAWLLNFGRWLVADGFAHALAHGLTQEEACEFYFGVLQSGTPALRQKAFFPTCR